MYVGKAAETTFVRKSCSWNVDEIVGRWEVAEELSRE